MRDKMNGECGRQEYAHHTNNGTMKKMRGLEIS
jgi:hypothetical protein